MNESAVEQPKPKKIKKETIRAFDIKIGHMLEATAVKIQIVKEREAAMRGKPLCAAAYEAPVVQPFVKKERAKMVLNEDQALAMQQLFFAKAGPVVVVDQPAAEAEVAAAPAP